MVHSKAKNADCPIVCPPRPSTDRVESDRANSFHRVRPAVTVRVVFLCAFKRPEVTFNAPRSILPLRPLKAAWKSPNRLPDQRVFDVVKATLLRKFAERRGRALRLMLEGRKPAWPRRSSPGSLRRRIAGGYQHVRPDRWRQHHRGFRFDHTDRFRPDCGRKYLRHAEGDDRGPGSIGVGNEDLRRIDHAIFEVEGSGPANVTVVFKDLEITDGKATDGVCWEARLLSVAES